jgi:hypothetical protein
MGIYSASFWHRTGASGSCEHDNDPSVPEKLLASQEGLSFILLRSSWEILHCKCFKSTA